MCGIAGIFGAADIKLISTMLDCQSARGPDDYGVFIDAIDGIAMGHRRLSILDLSQAGRQPMFDTTGRYGITYNGEIYNFRELKKELQDSGYRFRSTTDTEVIIYAFREWGPECVKRFRGMFAFALLDRGPQFGPDPKKNEHLPPSPYLFLARDRFGMKPLVYSFTQGKFIFASELKAIFASNLVPKTIDTKSLGDFLAVGAVFQPKTMIKNVFQLEPGTCMFVYEGNRHWAFRYYDLAEATSELREKHKRESYESLVVRTRELLEEAIRWYLVADVPVGAFLSGGVDSTSVVALMARQVSAPIQSFSVGFETTPELKDELSYAKIAAKRLGCVHHEVVVTPDDIFRLFDQLIIAIDQPSIDGTNTFLVSQAASQYVKVALSGLGGDELFAGYPHFRLLQTADRRRAGLLDRILASLHSLRPNRFTMQAAMNVCPPERRLASLRRILYGKAYNRAINGHYQKILSTLLIENFMQGLLRQDLSPLAQVSYAECRGYLQSTLLRDCDVMSMAHSLEVRPVLLDHVFAEHAFALPDEAKIRGGLMKAALVDAVRNIIPKETLARKKMGFEMPFVTWMLGPLRDRAVEALSSATAKRIFSDSYLKMLLRGFRSRKVPRCAWAWLVLVEWIRHHGCEVN